MTAAVRATVVDLSPADLHARLDEALSVYVEAMSYPASTVRQRCLGPSGQRTLHR